MAIERWNWEEREHREQFAGEAFVSIDPGTDGYALGWRPASKLPVGYCHAYRVDSLPLLLEGVGARVVVVEKQYVTSLKNARGTLELSFRMGMALGWLGAMLSLPNEERTGLDLHLFEVAPSTWQAHQRRQLGIGGAPERGDGIRIAVGRAEAVLGSQDEWKKATVKRKEGLASALGIADWWRAVQ